MTEKLVVNVTRYETRVAVLEGTAVTEVFIERNKGRGIVGNIYLGKVQRVLPGMQAAFVEIGLDKAAFLYVGDVVSPRESRAAEQAGEADRAAESAGDTVADRPGPKPIIVQPASMDADVTVDMRVGPKPFELDDETIDDTVEVRAGLIRPRPGEVTTPALEPSSKGKRRKKHRGRSQLRIEQVLKQGQPVLVQVAKGAIGTKGPRVTCNISLPGRHLVFMPMHDHIGVSRRITDEEERGRLKRILEDVRPDEGGGFVVRTVSQGLDEAVLREDARFLISMWEDIQQRSQTDGGPMLIQPEHDLMLRCARDYFTDDISQFVVDDAEAYESVHQFMQLREPRLLERVVKYEKDDPIFEYYGVEAEIDRAMSRKVWLKSGGYLVIDQAEALTAIDVNTGRFVGKRNLEDTILKTNLEAVKEVAAQLRFRNIGGMVIIDFIDMEVADHRERVLEALDDALTKDRARCNVVKMSELGLVEMTRQRTRESLGRQLSETCWYCEGRGVLKSKRTIVYDIFRTLERLAPELGEPIVVVQAHPEVADMMLDEERDLLAQIQEECGREIVVRPRGSFHQEQYDIFGTSEGSLARNTRSVASENGRAGQP